MMKLRNRSYVKYSTYALIAAFMVSMTPAGAMADISAGGTPVGTGDVEITGTTKVTGTLNASGARVKLGDTVANSLAANSLFIDKGFGIPPINVGEELNKLGTVLGADYKNPEFNTLTATGETTLGATTADSLTIGGTDIGAAVAANTTQIAANTTQIAANTTQIATNTTQIATNTTQIATNTGNIGVNTAEIAKIGTVLGADYKTPKFDSLEVTGETTLGGLTAGTANVTGDATVVGILTAGTANVAGDATVDGALTVDTAKVTGNATVDGTLDVTGETTLGGLTADTADVNGNATVGGTLDVTGETTLGVLTADTANVTGNATVGGTLDVTGETTLGVLTADTANVTGNLSAANGTFGTKVEVGMGDNKTVIESGTVTATGLGKFGSLEAGSAEFNGLKVNGATELNGALKVNSNVDATGTIHATGNISTDGNISAVYGTFTDTMTAQDAVIDNDLKVKHDATIDGTLRAGAGKVVADSSGLTVGNKVTVGAPSSPQTTIENGNITTDGNVGIGGTLDVTGNTTLDGALTANGDAAFNNNASIGNDLTVGNNASIGNQLTIGKDADGNALTTIENGDITTAGKLDVTGNTTLGGTLNVAGDATFASNAAVEGNFDVAGTTTLGGKLTANGGALINKGLEVNGDAAFNNNLTVKGESSLKGKVTIGTDANQTIIDGDKVDTGTVNTDYANVDEKLTVGTAEGNQTFVEGSKITSEAGVQGTTVIDGGKLTVSKPVTTRTPGDDKTEIDGGNITATGKGTFGSLQVNGNANIGGDATVDGKLYAMEGGVFSNSASDFSNNTVINGDGMEIRENGTVAAYYGKYGMQVGGLTYDGMRNSLNMGGGTITGLADGGVYRGSSDAVTGNQLWQAYKRMDDLQESINIVGAHAAALSGLAPVPYNPYQPTTLSAAIGTYRDEYAVAVGVYHYVRDDVMFNLGASICSDGDLMGRAGISFAVGKKDKDKPALAQNMNDVQKQLMEVQYALQELKDENAALKKQLRKQ